MAASIIDGMQRARGRWKYSDDSEQLTLDDIWDHVNHDSDYMINYCEACKSEEKLHAVYVDYFIAARNVGVDAVPMWECQNCKKIYTAHEIFDAVDQIIEQLDLHHTTINYSEIAKEVLRNDNDD